ncbi:MAG: NAD-binding protein [Chloroflexota bacterium]|nr:NAD-binding protein [Chloroflexota bacterium]MDE2942207.1 NAD-binding protein [Chloroflexota bacterium]MDE3267675.1 NAD-binding protein [Chloroflexota bacterium]
MYVLVMGSGEIGALVATSLWQEGHLVSVIDTSLENLRRLPKGLQENAILGDGVQEENLRRAGAEDTDAFVAVSSEDIDNIFAAQMASHVFQVGRVVCRIDDPALCQLYSELGLDAVSGAEALSGLIFQAVNG